MGQVTILGIVNITADSFSDGGRYLDPRAAVAQARALVADGADVVDLGPASSNPDAGEVSSEEEIRRLRPVVDALRADAVAVSVDSWQPQTQLWAIEQGVAYLNDIRGFCCADIYPELAAADCKLIVMHSLTRGERAEREAVDAARVLASIESFFDERIADLERAGIARERLIVDPGMGLFLGSDPQASVAVLRALPQLAQRYRLPLLVSVSRKSVVGALSGRPVAERGAATLAAELYAAARGCDYIRTHDAGALRDALAVTSALD